MLNHSCPCSRSGRIINRSEACGVCDEGRGAGTAQKHADICCTSATDEGRRLDLRADPPVVVANEVKEAVRRPRWKEADAILPGLVPAEADSGTQSPHANRTVLVPCVSAISAMLKGKACPPAGPTSVPVSRKYVCVSANNFKQERLFKCTHSIVRMFDDNM